MAEPTIMQLAYINGLYGDLDVPYTRRVKPESSRHASELINELKARIEDKKNTPTEED